VLVLRTASNYSRAPIGQTSLPHVFHGEGLKASFDSTFRVGGVVVRELTAHWDRYASEIPNAPSIKAGRSQ
jgi:purine nucleoside permease